MWEYDHNTLPLSLKSYFKRANLVHNYSTRAASKGSLHYNKVNTVKYGIKSFKYQGLKILNDLKKTSIYQNSRTKSKFLKDLKSDLLSEYTTCVCVCVCACVRACVRVCVCVCILLVLL